MEANINFRVPKQLMEDFDKSCQANYTTKSEVLRQSMVEYVKKNQGGSEMKTKMTWEQIVDEARQRAFGAGNITDDRDEFEKDPNLWLVKDMQLVVDAHIKDIEAGDTAEDAGPEEFFARHGIEVE